MALLVYLAVFFAHTVALGSAKVDVRGKVAAVRRGSSDDRGQEAMTMPPSPAPTAATEHVARKVTVASEIEAEVRRKATPPSSTDPNCDDVLKSAAQDDARRILCCERFEDRMLTTASSDDPRITNLRHRWLYGDRQCRRLGGWKATPEDVTKNLFTEAQQLCTIDRLDITKLEPEYLAKHYIGKKPFILVDPTPNGDYIFKPNMDTYLPTLTRATIRKEEGEKLIGTSRVAITAKIQRPTINPGDPPPTFILGPERGDELPLKAYIDDMDRPWRPGYDSPTHSDYIIAAYGALPPGIDRRARQSPFISDPIMPERESGRRGFLLGGTGSGAPFHKHGPAWLQLWFGYKRYFLKAPKPGDSHAPADEVASKEGEIRNTTLQWLYDTGPLGYAAVKAASDKEAERTHAAPSLVECLVGPGELIYTPPMWWHGTVNIGNSVSVVHFEMRKG